MAVAYRSRMPAVTAALLDHSPVTEAISKVLFQVSTLDATRDDMRTAIQKQLPEGVNFIPRSFTVADTRNLAISGLVTRTQVTLDGESLHADGKYRVMSSNVLMDIEDKSLWNVTAKDGKRTLSRQCEESLADMLSEVSCTVNQRRADLPTLEKVTSAVVPSTQKEISYVAYLNDEQEVSHGFVETSGKKKVTYPGVGKGEYEGKGSDHEKVLHKHGFTDGPDHSTGGYMKPGDQYGSHIIFVKGHGQRPDKPYRQDKSLWNKGETWSHEGEMDGVFASGSGHKELDSYLTKKASKIDKDLKEQSTLVTIFNPKLDASVTVQSGLVIAEVVAEVEVSDAHRPDDFATMKEYYRKVYGYSKDYLAAFEQMIDDSLRA